MAANPDGGVFDGRLLTGEQSSGGVTITLTKPNIEIIFGTCTITVTAAPFIVWADGVSTSDRTGAGDGCIVRGSGMDATSIEAAAAISPILRMQSYNPCLRDLQVRYSTVDAASLCIDLNTVGASGLILRPHIRNVRLVNNNGTTDVAKRNSNQPIKMAFSRYIIRNIVVNNDQPHHGGGRILHGCLRGRHDHRRQHPDLRPPHGCGEVSGCYAGGDSWHGCAHRDHALFLADHRPRFSGDRRYLHLWRSSSIK